MAASAFLSRFNLHPGFELHFLYGLNTVEVQVNKFVYYNRGTRTYFKLNKSDVMHSAVEQDLMDDQFIPLGELTEEQAKKFLALTASASVDVPLSIDETDDIFEMACLRIAIYYNPKIELTRRQSDLVFEFRPENYKKRKY
jgi:hypothetical protein